MRTADHAWITQPPTMPGSRDESRRAAQPLSELLQAAEMVLRLQHPPGPQKRSAQLADARREGVNRTQAFRRFAPLAKGGGGMRRVETDPWIDNVFLDDFGGGVVGRAGGGEGSREWKEGSGGVLEDDLVGVQDRVGFGGDGEAKVGCESGQPGFGVAESVGDVEGGGSGLDGVEEVWEWQRVGRERWEMSKGLIDDGKDEGLLALERERVESGRDAFFGDRDCCEEGCFENADPHYAFAQYCNFRKMSLDELKGVLVSFLDKRTNRFRYDGMFVCSTFLKALTFSKGLQRQVLSSANVGAVSSATAKSSLSVLAYGSSGEVDTAVTKVSGGSGKRRRADDRAMKDETRTKKTKKESKKKQDSHSRAAKLRDLCARLDEMALGNDDEGKVAQRRYCALMFGRTPRRHDERDGNRQLFQYHCVGVHDYGSGAKYFALSADRRSSKTARSDDVVIQTAHQVLYRLKQVAGTFPEMLHVQIDALCSDVKTVQCMAYFEMLVSRGVFLEVVVSFSSQRRPSDHAEEFLPATDVRTVDVSAIADFMDEVRNDYSGLQRQIVELTAVAEWAELCNTSMCLNEDVDISQFSDLRFERTGESPYDGYFEVTCNVRTSDDMPWVPLVAHEGVHQFMECVPPLPDGKAQPSSDSHIRTPLNTGKETVALDPHMTNEGHVGEPNKAQSEECVTRRAKVHWNPHSLFELHGDYMPTGVDQQSVLGGASHGGGGKGESSNKKNNVLVNEFVAVRWRSVCGFRIGMVDRINGVDAMYGLKADAVMWYAPVIQHHHLDPYYAKYQPITVWERGYPTYWREKVSVEALPILMPFESLTANDLRAAVRRKIQGALEDKG